MDECRLASDRQHAARQNGSDWTNQHNQGTWVMYDAYFGFSDRPFASVPCVDQYFPGTTIETARQTLARCIERGEGVGVVVGPSGTGKTLLCQMLQQQFANAFQVALLSSGRLSTRRALLQAILYELGLPYRGMEEGELRLALIDHLTVSEYCPLGIVLLVDEAHTLPLRLLDEIRMLTNVARDGMPRVRLVLAGGSVLEERFASPKLDSFSQRMVARCYLESLTRTETQDYIHIRINAAAGLDSAAELGRQIFSDDACQSVHRATDGVPRLINQVCDHALVLAYVGSVEQLQAAHVDEAWADLQQLPTPWNAEREDEDGGGVIEFGGLDDHAADAQQTASGGHSAPSLRISPETDRRGPRTPEPAEQLHRIEQMLDNVAEDFQPAGSSGPEAELTFDDPFKEEFEQEEVIADPYLPPSAAAAATPPPVGGQPWEPPQEEPAAEAVPTETVELEPDAACQREDVDDAQQHDTEAEASEEPDPAEQRDESVAARHEAGPETVPLRPRQPRQVLEGDDDDVVVIEDDFDKAASAGKCPIVAVRQHEYGQLFAKLRRRG